VRKPAAFNPSSLIFIHLTCGFVRLTALLGRLIGRWPKNFSPYDALRELPGGKRTPLREPELAWGRTGTGVFQGTTRTVMAAPPVARARM
jgi:hypothetical protein